ncbi:hypothetical protein AGDE_02182 [Angomonas deanei]|uniref:SET domain containing protein, putative n=1 Tax=Angomonas deanei TaxID=59799 RepID=S9WPV3_9TRYP|nr:hypothetical protein AGDE_02619 [Angomonas deanei]EPY41742.1 hypothetical protein AGDE_02182 [Angomonas deanei]CAD2219163.1 SET domain containing protein, putative [Angomonas deanei]|eukprot:EPY41306.1 hypothetical protein AGDE_02619 [Angomonas deanei]
MPTYENRHLLRVLKSPNEIAKDFIAYCKLKQVTSRGLCRVGYVQRKPPSAAGDRYGLPSDPSRYRLRGLIANKDIEKDENIVIVPERSTLSPATALRCKPFMSLLPPEMQREYFLTDKFIKNSRIIERSLVRHNQLLLAWYMTYIIVMSALEPATLATVPGSEVMQYINFMPRSEGQFDTLADHLSGWLDTPEMSRQGQVALASRFGVSQAEIRPVILYCLCMIYSRMVPVDHRGLLQFAFRETELENKFTSTALPTPDANGILPPATAPSPVVDEPIGFLCPMIDMCNHSTHENVAVMVPNDENYKPSALTGPVICLRSLRPIRKDEELTMTYGAAERELKLIWGMVEILE